MLRRFEMPALAAAVVALLYIGGSDAVMRRAPPLEPSAVSASSAPAPAPAPAPRASAPHVAAAAVAALPRLADFGEAAAPARVRRIAHWALTSGDHAGLPYVVLDKIGARVYVFDSRGRLTGHSAVLLGFALGDDSVPGIGERPIAQIRPFERTTPAGRFVSEPGRNSHGEDIVWVDYDAAVSMHRVRATNPKERRLQRLASATVDDNRISYGCINVPSDFYDARIDPVFGRSKAIVYVLPEVRPLEQVFALNAPGRNRTGE